MFEYILDKEPNPKDDNFIREQLRKFNFNYLKENANHYSVFIKNGKGEIIGGSLIYQHTESIYIDTLWVDSNFRKKEIGSNLLRKSELEGSKRGCKFSIVDTYSFQAKQFYEKNNYIIFAEVPDYLNGYSKIFLKKRLSNVQN